MHDGPTASRHRLSAKSSTSCNSGSTRCRQIRCWLLAMGEQLLGSRTKSWPPVHRHTEAQVNWVEPRPVSPFFAAPTADTLRNRAATTAGSCLARPSATSPTGSTRRPANGPLRLCRVGSVLWEPSHPGRVKDADDRGPVMQAQFPAQRRRGLGTRRSPADAGHYRRRWRDNGQCWRPFPAVIYRAVAWPNLWAERPQNDCRRSVGRSGGRHSSDVSYHLGIPCSAALVARSRRGRHVLHQRSKLANSGRDQLTGGLPGRECSAPRDLAAVRVISDPSVLPGDPVRLRSRAGLQLLGDRREVVADPAG